MRNKEIEKSLLNLTQGPRYYKNYPDEIKKVMDYIDKLERENFGLKKTLENMKEKEARRYERMARH